MNNTTQTTLLNLDQLGTVRGVNEIGNYTRASIAAYPVGQLWTIGGGATAVVEFEVSVDGDTWTSIGTLGPISSGTLELLALDISAYSQSRFIVRGVETGMVAQCTLYAYDRQY